jgi:hypothetical protein
MWDWESNWGPLEEKPVLLTTELSPAHFPPYFEIGPPSKSKSSSVSWTGQLGAPGISLCVLHHTVGLENRELGSGEMAQKDYRCALPQLVCVLLDPALRESTLSTELPAQMSFFGNTLEKPGSCIFSSLTLVSCPLLQTCTLVTASSQRSLLTVIHRSLELLIVCVMSPSLTSQLTIPVAF